MIDSIAYILAFIITLPLLITILIFRVTYSLRKKKRYAIHLAIDLTTILYIISVGCIIYTLFNVNIFGYIFIALLLLLISMVIIHWRLYTDIVFVDVWKRFWKASFLLFFFIHFILMIYGIIHTIRHII